MSSSEAPTAPAPEGDAIVFRWDLDKTYLRTEFESFRQMVKIPFEAGIDKVHLPGVPQLIQGLRRSAIGRGERPFVFFLSASPPQIGAAIREKLLLDGIEYEGIVFKDQLRNLMRGQWRQLREQMGYKLGELLRSRVAGPVARREILFGDDWESDPLIYSLYADIVAGTLSADAAAELLAMLDVEKNAIARIHSAAQELTTPAPSAVIRIYINLERRTPPARFHPFGSRLVPAFNYFQTGASLYEEGLLAEAELIALARALIGQSGFSGERLRNSLDDLVRRGHLRPGTRARAIQILAREKITSPRAQDRLLRARLAAALERWRERRGGEGGPRSFSIDYKQIIADRAGHP